MTEQQGHILVVDDNRINRIVLTRALETLGYSVATAEHGRQALDRLHEPQEPPIDVVLLDILMPELDGYETLTQLQADPQLRHIPAIMISALDELDSVVRCIELGAADYLLKPFNPVLLRARVGACVEKKRLRDAEQQYLRGLERELEIGREIQSGFLPATLPQPNGWEIAARFRAAREVAGDFYDAFALPNGTISLVIGDVCGKGVGAALFMTLFRSLLRAGANLEAFTGRASVGSNATPTPASILHDSLQLTNNYIEQIHGNTHMFATIFFGVLDPLTGALSYINAGHERPLVLDAYGLKHELERTGPFVGIFSNWEFQVAETVLEQGDTLLVVTDGVADANNIDKQFFTRERLLELVESPPPLSSALLDRIDRALKEHIGIAEQFDDITMIAVRRAFVADSTAQSGELA